MTPKAQLPALIGGRYRPVRLIARGGMGAVYEVVHANTGEHLALKLMLARSLLSPDAVKRFQKEARIQSSVKSEHVVRVVDADVAPELDGAPFLVMELLSGQDLERICTERQPSLQEVVEWLRQVSPALDKAHRERIIHRDLKPENLFLAQREEAPAIVKILDFGVAKMESEGDPGATGTGQILGTPRYMAPEQALSAKRITGAVDRFALGLIAFRLLCGRHYFDDENWVRLLQTVTLGPRASPSKMGCAHGPAFDAWFARACALDPGQRFACCVEQVEALAAALAGVSITRQGNVRVGPRRRTLAMAGVAGTCGIVAAVWGIGRVGSKAAATAAPSPPPLAGLPAAVQPPATPPPPPTGARPAIAVAPPVELVPAKRPASGPSRRRSARIPNRVAKAEPAPEPKDSVWGEP